MYRWAVAVMMSVFVSENVLAENWGTKDYIQQYEKEMKALDGSMKNSFSSFSQDITATKGDRNKNSKSKEKVKNTIPYYDSQAKEQDFSEKNLRKKGHESQVKEGIAKDDDIKAEQDASIRGEKSAIKFRQESYLRKHRYKEGDLKDVTDQNIPNKGDIGLDIAEVIENPLIGLNKGDEQGGLDTACSVSDSENTTVKPKLESYEVEIDDVREKESGHECQEDDGRLYQCDRILKAGDCIVKEDCGEDAGGFIKGSVASDMKFVYRYPNLTVGTIADNYWSGDCQEYSRNTTFTIRDLNKIKEFRIKEVGFDDHMLIKVNGHVVHVGPFGGTELSRSWSNKYRGMPRGWHWSVWTGKEDHYCELGISRQYNVDIDVKPYLREGENTIFIKVFVGGRGEGWMEIKVSQYCCNKWGSDKWESDCPVD